MSCKHFQITKHTVYRTPATKTNGLCRKLFKKCSKIEKNRDFGYSVQKLKIAIYDLETSNSLSECVLRRYLLPNNIFYPLEATFTAEKKLENCEI